MTISEKMIDVEGSPVHYYESGAYNGRTLLLLSGGIGDAWSNWSNVIEPLAEEYHVLAPDLPGFSGSAALPDMRFDALLHWLKALLDAFGQSEAVIVSHSMSALLARLFASASPEYVPALIMSNGGTFPNVPSWLPRLMKLPLVGNLTFEIFGRMTCGQKTLDHLVYNPDAPKDDLLKAWHNNTHGFSQLIRALLMYPAPKNRTPLVPTLLLWGANDSMMTMAHGEQLKREIPGAQLVPIAECGHVPSVETSDVFAFQVRAFLDQLSRPTIPTHQGVGMLQPIGM
jgi:pimeloyl-ACP methyl ester carboxylesterase